MATRLPFGGDHVIIGHPCDNPSPYSPPFFNCLSPLLFGGISAGNTAFWHGATSGTTSERNGLVTLTVNPSYHFSQIGGDINTQILNEWGECARWSGFGYGFTYGSWAVASGGTAGDPNTSFVTTAWGGITSGSGWTFSRPTDAPDSYIRLRGIVSDASYKTTLYLRGTTAALTTGMQGATTSYDGSSNSIRRSNKVFTVAVQGTTGNRGPCGGVPTPVSASVLLNRYESGSVYASGYWNEIRQVTGTSGGTIVLKGCTANFVDLQPQISFFYGGIATNPSYSNPLSSPVLSHIPALNGPTSGAANSLAGPNNYFNGFILENLVVDKMSSVRTLVFTPGDVTENTIIEGDVGGGQGFNCEYPAGGTGGTGAAGNIQANMIITAPSFTSNPRVCTLGFPQGETSRTATNIGTLASLAGAGPEWNVEICGNTNITKLILQGGEIRPMANIRETADINITDILAYNDCIINMANAPTHEGIASNVYCYSPSVQFKPLVGQKIVTFADVTLTGS